jgi:hypothetical protein
MSPCEAQSKQQQNEDWFKWGKGKNEISVINKISVIECEKNVGGG